MTTTRTRWAAREEVLDQPPVGQGHLRPAQHLPALCARHARRLDRDTAEGEVVTRTTGVDRGPTRRSDSSA